MKIAIVTNFPADIDRPHGGVEAVSVNLVRSLAKLDGLDVHVVTTDKACCSVSETAWIGALVYIVSLVGALAYVFAPAVGNRVDAAGAEDASRPDPQAGVCASNRR